MKAVQISKPRGNFELVEREIAEPARGQVRIKVEACGICHSDAVVKEGHWPGLQYPRVPGHEIAGRVDAVGVGVSAKDSEDTLRFSVLTGVRPMIERYPLEKATEAYEQMISGRARFRVVLTMGR